jgi:hypothetical protein
LCLIILDDEFQLPPKDAARLVDLVGRELRTLGLKTPGFSTRAGKRSHHADLDRIGRLGCVRR